MDRLVVLTVATVIVAAVAVFNLVSAWPLHLNAVLLVVGLALFGIAMALYGALLVVGVGERRRIVAGAASAVEVVGRAASSFRWSALASVALSVVLFANCSGSVTTGPPSYAGPMDVAAGSLTATAANLLPISLVR